MEDKRSGDSGGDDEHIELASYIDKYHMVRFRGSEQDTTTTSRTAGHLACGGPVTAFYQTHPGMSIIGAPLLVDQPAVPLRCGRPPCREKI